MFSEEINSYFSRTNYCLNNDELNYILSTSPQIVEPRKIDKELYGEIVIRTNENQNWNVFVTNK
jgi:hypothetical protein